MTEEMQRGNRGDGEGRKRMKRGKRKKWGWKEEER